MKRTLIRAGLALALTLTAASETAARAYAPPSNPLLAAWSAAALAGTTPGDLAAATGTFTVSDRGDVVSDAQAAAAERLLPEGYAVAAAIRQDRVLLVTTLAADGDGVLATVRGTVLATGSSLPAALPAIGVVAARYLERADGRWVERAEVRDGSGRLVHVVERPSSQAAAKADECSCGLAWTAVAAWAGSCAAAAVVVTGPGAPVAAAGCAVGGVAFALMAENYCDTCEGTKGVTLQPGFAEGWQSTDHPNTTWLVCYNAPQPDGLIVGLQINAYMNYLTPRHAASNRCAWFEASFACCTSDDRLHDVYAWVEFPVGDWGRATGKVLVHRYGA